MNKFIPTKIAFALLTAGVFAQPSMANDINLAAYTIPASDCQPASPAAAAKVKLYRGSYVFRGNATGTVSLLCPLNLSGWQAGKSLLEQDWSSPTMSMTEYRVYYKDPNSCQTGSGVQVSLRFRNENGLKSPSSAWTSWQKPDPNGPSTFCFPKATENQHTTETVKNLHTIKNDRLYHFLVKIKRSKDTQATAFSGIDFPLDIRIEG